MIFRLARSILRRNRDSPLESELARLEEEAKAPALDFRAAVFGRAGDLCIQAGQKDRALTYYGKAIDGYLGLGYYDTAMAMCEKVIALAPEVVRTRCTMAFLLLAEDLPYLRARGVSDEARKSLQEYVRSAMDSGHQRTAVERLRMMAHVTEAPTVRQLIADLLFELQAPDEAAELHYELFEERANLGEPAPESSRNQRDRWAEMLRVSIMDG